MGDHLVFLIQRFIVACAICVGYCTLGGLLFFYIEECQYSGDGHGSDKNIWQNVKPEKVNLTCSRILLLIEMVVNDSKAITSHQREKLYAGCEDIFQPVRNQSGKMFSWDLSRRCDIDLKSMYKWIYFASITTLTIGYGDIVPKSDVGKVVVILYSLVGIPLALVSYTLAGKMVSSIVRLIIILVEKYILRRREVRSIEEKGLLIGVILFLTTLICSAWTISSDITGWRFIDSFYFIFISLSTIGYGDFVINPEVFSNEPWFAALTTFIIVFGIGILAGTIDSALTILTRERKLLIKRMCTCRRPKEDDSLESDTTLDKGDSLHPIDFRDLTKEEKKFIATTINELEDTAV